jgi:hypothetical protein
LIIGAVDEGSALRAIFAAETEAASPAKPIRVRRRDVRVSLLFEDMTNQYIDGI